MTRAAISFLFFIRKAKMLKNGEVPIYLRITSNRQSIEIAIGRRILPDLWNAKAGGALGNSKEARDINDYINHVRFQLRDVMQHLRTEEMEVTPLNIKNTWLGIVPDEKTILGIFREYNDEVKQLVGKHVVEATRVRYETAFKHLSGFIQHSYKKEDIPLSKLGYEFIKDFEFYLKTRGNLSHNTAMKYIKNLKTIIRRALANGWMRADPFANYKMTHKKVDRGFLTEEELNAVRTKELPIGRLAQVRDIFLVGCMTGLAYSDLKKLCPQNLVKGDDGRLWIHVCRTKTDNACHIPLLPLAAQIINKYSTHPHCIRHNVLLPVSTNQKLNAYLKEIAAICGIQKELTTHIARHTFATTVTLNNDIPIETVSKMLGHSSINMTRIYARLLDKKVSSDMNKLFQKYSA